MHVCPTCDAMCHRDHGIAVSIFLAPALKAVWLFGTGKALI